MHLPIYLNMWLKTCLLLKTLNDQYIKTLLILHLIYKLKHKNIPLKWLKTIQEQKWMSGLQNHPRKLETKVTIYRWYHKSQKIIILEHKTAQNFEHLWPTDMFLPYEVRRSPPSSKEGYLQSIQRRSRSFKSLRHMRKLITFDIFARIQSDWSKWVWSTYWKDFYHIIKKYIKGKWKRKTARPSIILEITYNIFYDVLFNLIMLIYFRRKWLKIHVTINYFSIIFKYSNA